MVLAIFAQLHHMLHAQETTAGLQGVVKDNSGAVVSGAKVVITGTTLIGEKTVVSDGSGYYRFANLPPGTYALTVSAAGFETKKLGGVTLEVGHLPSLDLSLQVGSVSTVVEVTGSAPLIDVTTNTTQTTIPEDVIQDVPHGRSFQSVIQFAPSARNEPLAGNTSTNGTGGASPGSTTNGSDHGFSIAGGADSENSYLVEGQETANIIGGYSHTSVPFDFIQEVQVKSSGIEAEHGGALGGVVNVIMKKGTDNFHGSVFSQFEDGAFDGSPTASSRYDPSVSNTPTSWGAIDPTYQNYQPVRPHTSDVQPGFTVGGPIWKDHIFGFAAFDPEISNYEEKVNYGPTNGGVVPFSQNTRTYYTTARIDAAITDRLRVFGSWLYQHQREYGQALPSPDSVQGYFNPTTGCFGSATSATNPCLSSGVPAFALSHALGFAAPNSTTNTGVDWTINQSLVATTRFGYYFENYHDFGYPTAGNIYAFAANGIGGTDVNGNPLPADLQESAGYFNIAEDSNFTVRNANKAIQFDQDLAWYKSGWAGTHNFKFGYQLNRLSNYIDQHFNTPYVQVLPGTSNPYNPQGPVGAANCAPLIAANGACLGTYGTVDVYDYGSNGKATSYNNAFFAQDSWQLSHGVTINAGFRVEHEALPAENQPSGSIATPINFGWGSKVAPRIGGAWDVFKDGKMKVFASYGQFYDIMKLNLAISSYGGQYWQECWYALNTPNLSDVAPVFDSTGRYCSGPNSASQANFGGTTPAGLTFLENQNLRAFPTTCSTCSATEEGTAPGLKPYKQHESVAGVDYALSPTLAFEARWDRRKIDHVIEDSAIFNPAVGETFVVVNPGEGINSTFNGFYNFLYGAPPDCSNGCPPQQTIKPARSYDGLELRLTKATTNHWFGMFSYTYSHFRGNYTGLTSTDVADGGGGRNAPNNSRSFDEPLFSWNASGGSSSGLLPTDRPSAFKGYAYYELPWLRKFTTDFGLFQYAYSGTPLTSYLDVGYAFPGGFPVDVVNRGKWIDVSQNNSDGTITIGNPYTKRTPWYTQSDFNILQNYKVTESKTVSFQATFTNILNQRAVVSEGQQIDSGYAQNFVAPQSAGCAAENGGSPYCTLFNGPAGYAAFMTPYNLTSVLNNSPSNAATGAGPITVNSQYGKPYLYQQPRSIRLAVKFTF